VRSNISQKLHQPCHRGAGHAEHSQVSSIDHSFGGEYLELVPHERIRWTDRFDDPNLRGEMRVTVTLKKVSVGTEVNIVQEGLPDVIREAPVQRQHESARPRTGRIDLERSRSVP
jgi:uncharacterized protein YndB with AHSA1/START domain